MLCIAITFTLFGIVLGIGLMELIQLYYIRKNSKK